MQNQSVWLKGQWRIPWDDPAIRVAHIDPASHTITFAAGIPLGLGNKYTRPFGNGKVLFMGTDGAWRWRLGVEDKYHYRFWGQVIRWMAHQRHLAHAEGLRFFYTPESPNVGERVFFHATLFDAAGQPLQHGTARGRITTPGVAQLQRRRRERRAVSAA